MGFSVIAIYKKLFKTSRRWKLEDKPRKAGHLGYSQKMEGESKR
jgi:hypothetical protein